MGAAAEGLGRGGLTLGGEFSIMVATCLEKRESEREKSLARLFSDKEVEIISRGSRGGVAEGVLTFWNMF